MVPLRWREGTSYPLSSPGKENEEENMRSSTRWVHLLVVLVGVTVPAWGQELPWVFYDTFESGDTSGWWAPARVRETGQVRCYDQYGTGIACAGTGQDGEHRSGVAWPIPRFENNGDGTVTDMLTGLVWLRDASCADLAGTDASGRGDWITALSAAAALADGTCGLIDGSAAGDWRLPSVNELQSLVDYEYSIPALSNAEGTGQWTEGDAFSGVESLLYWSSTSFADAPTSAWPVYLYNGTVYRYAKSNVYHIWPVRGGQ